MHTRLVNKINAAAASGATTLMAHISGAPPPP
jgi:hypothetical protein